MTRQGQELSHPQERSVPVDPPMNEPGSVTDHDAASSERTESFPKDLSDTKGGSSLARRGTGPRTAQGKNRSKLNALKHGIFSEAVLLNGESSAAYESLLEGLRADLSPQGCLEETLVEKLAITVWRYRRLIQAESAEIKRSTQFLEWDLKELQERSAADDLHSPHQKQNPIILDKCIELLTELRRHIEANGFDSEEDLSILKKIYGETYLGDPPDNEILASYMTWSATSEASEEEREREGYSTPATCRELVIAELDAEIRRLKRYRKARASIESERIRLDQMRLRVPDAPSLDRLLRYEASLERSFDRTLSQLERLQRMRLGQPTVPPLEVKVST